MLFRDFTDFFLLIFLVGDFGAFIIGGGTVGTYFISCLGYVCLLSICHSGWMIEGCLLILVDDFVKFIGISSLRLFLFLEVSGANVLF